ncbi:hypothetical protein sscle_12g091480 [Sclerotinia sclerotiorum 1980 UF-70]|uniref:Uncharacterized protein n=1 Tax=Sclerotinia sclerotiorum (strain ATCC 18683 / 1980 / Ss-1) TaxID=665079 RepID=A0A1D9QHI5_SCLS1|nr:hypothetical protein sscle_12g091480 [Sclerotinia sclerotiorum 1980 UF-70]
MEVLRRAEKVTYLLADLGASLNLGMSCSEDDITGGSRKSSAIYPAGKDV